MVRYPRKCAGGPFINSDDEGRNERAEVLEINQAWGLF